MSQPKSVKLTTLVEWDETTTAPAGNGRAVVTVHKSCQVEIRIDVAKIAARLGPRAATNASGHAIALGGILRAERVGEVVAAQALEASQ